MQGFYRIARGSEARSSLLARQPTHQPSGVTAFPPAPQKNSQSIDQTTILLRLRNYGIGLLRRPRREEFLIRGQHDDGHFRSQPLQFSE